MAVISGGNVVGPSTTNPGLKNRVYHVDAVPTDANVAVGFAAANGMLAENVVTGFLYERQASVWVRIDTV